MDTLIYIGGAIDQAPKETLQFYINLSIELEKQNFLTYVPRRESLKLDPNSIDYFKNIYKMNNKAITNSQIALFYIGAASSGTGLEIGENINNYNCKNIYYYNENEGKKPSCHILGFLEVRNKKVYKIPDLAKTGIKKLIEIIKWVEAVK